MNVLKIKYELVVKSYIQIFILNMKNFFINALKPSIYLTFLI